MAALCGACRPAEADPRFCRDGGRADVGAASTTRLATASFSAAAAAARHARGRCARRAARVERALDWCACRRARARGAPAPTRRRADGAAPPSVGLVRHRARVATRSARARQLPPGPAMMRAFAAHGRPGARAPCARARGSPPPVRRQLPPRPRRRGRGAATGLKLAGPRPSTPPAARARAWRGVSGRRSPRGAVEARRGPRRRSRVTRPRRRDCLRRAATADRRAVGNDSQRHGSAAALLRDGDLGRGARDRVALSCRTTTPDAPAADERASGNESARARALRRAAATRRRAAARCGDSARARARARVDDRPRGVPRIGPQRVRELRPGARISRRRTSGDRVDDAGARCALGDRALRRCHVAGACATCSDVALPPPRLRGQRQPLDVAVSPVRRAAPDPTLAEFAARCRRRARTRLK